MANADRPKGLRPYERAMRESVYTAGGTVYPGDAVRINGSGLVVVATASQSLKGVAANYAASGSTVRVWDHPDQKFIVQGDNGTTLAQTAVGLNYNIVATSGNATYRQSRMELDSSSGATDSNLPLRLLAFQPAVDNVAGEFAECVVLINDHQDKAGVEGA